jgi:hypothetical protein
MSTQRRPDKAQAQRMRGGNKVKPAEHFAETQLDDVIGCLRPVARPADISKQTAVERQIARRHERGRY